jgi:tetratricopeptide (TPR) repeat protein
VGICHFSIAMSLLGRNSQLQPECLNKQKVSFPTNGSEDEIRLAIGELETAKRTAFSVSPESIDLFRAGAFIELGQTYLRRGDTTRAEEAFSSAQNIYRTLLQAAPRPDSIAAIAIGFLRSGDPKDSIIAAAELNQHSPMRTYLIAEALFSLGDREGAAREYTAWIDTGCASPLIAMTNDDYGEGWWTYLFSNDKSLGACEQLPAELRTRLEALRDQTGHLGNLPKSNKPPPLYQPVSK